MPLKTWAMCCDESVSKVKESHQHLGENSTDGLVTKKGETVQQCFCMWKRNSCCVMNPHYIHNGKPLLPNLLENYHYTPIKNGLVSMSLQKLQVTWSKAQ